MATGDDQLFGQEHVRAYRETGGERGSGEERTTPIHRPDDGRWVVVASNGGSTGDPSWYQAQIDREIPVVVLEHR